MLPIIRVHDKKYIAYHPTAAGNDPEPAVTLVVYARTGPLSRLKAVLLVSGSPPGRVPWPAAQMRDHGVRAL